MNGKQRIDAALKIISPAIILMGIIISYFEKPTDQYILKKVRFFNKVGAPWFGKNDYLKHMESLDIKGI